MNLIKGQGSRRKVCGLKDSFTKPPLILILYLINPLYDSIIGLIEVRGEYADIVYSYPLPRLTID